MHKWWLTLTELIYILFRTLVSHLLHSWKTTAKHTHTESKAKNTNNVLKLFPFYLLFWGYIYWLHLLFGWPFSPRKQCFCKFRSTLQKFQCNFYYFLWFPLVFSTCIVYNTKMQASYTLELVVVVFSLACQDLGRVTIQSLPVLAFLFYFFKSEDQLAHTNSNL